MVRSGLESICCAKARRKAAIKLAAVTGAALLLICLALACGRGGGRALGGSALSSVGESQTAGQSSGQGDAFSNPHRTLSIEEAIEEARAYEPPADAGVDPSVFDMLRDEFIRALEERAARGVSMLPCRETSAGGRDDYIDLDDVYVMPMPDGTNQVEWQETLAGDFDCNGEVGVPDITPIAQNYLHIYGDGIDDEKDRYLVQMGSDDNEIGVPDITVIATNYLALAPEGYDVWRTPSGGGDAERIPNPTDPDLPTIGRESATLADSTPASYTFSDEDYRIVSSARGVSSIDQNGRGWSNGDYYYSIEPRLDETEPPPALPEDPDFNINVIYDSPFRINVGETVTARVEVYGDAAPATYGMNWGDGAVDVVSTPVRSMTFSHVYKSAGRFAPKVAVTGEIAGVAKTQVQYAPVVQVSADTPFTPIALDISKITDGVRITWDIVDPSPAETYNVYWSLRRDDSRPALLNPEPLTTNTFDAMIVGKLLPGKHVYFKVSAVKGGLESKFSLESKWPPVGIEPPALSILGTSTDGNVDLSWNAVQNQPKYDVIGYTVYKADELGGASPVLVSGTDILPATQTSFTYTPELDEQLLFFFARTVTDIASSGRSNEIVWTHSLLAGRIPVPMASAGAATGPPPYAAIFSADGSYDPDGTIVSYEWRFFDEDTFRDFTSTAGDTMYTYKQAGVYTATLRIVDNDGIPAYQRLTITVSEAPVDILGVSPQFGDTGTQVTFNASLTGTPPYTYEWYFGGGATPNTSTAASPRVTLGAVGTYDASVTIGNDFGAADTYNWTLNVFDPSEPNPYEGALPDSLFLYPSTTTVNVGDSFDIFVFAYDNANPLDFLSSVFIQVDQSLAEVTGSITQGDYFDIYDGILLASPIIQMPTFIESTIAYTEPPIGTTHRSGMLFTINFTALEPGIIVMDVLESDGQGGRTFYQDYALNEYTWSHLGRDLDGNLSVSDNERQLRITVNGTGKGVSVKNNLNIDWTDTFLNNRTLKTPSRAPLGERNKVTDLAYNSGDNTLTWTYLNLGDYDQNGEVNISDMTLLAQNYSAKTDDGLGDDVLEQMIDGNSDGQIRWSDIVTIAVNFQVNCSGYAIETSDAPDGSYAPIGAQVDFNSSLYGPPRTFECALPVGALQYVRVVPFDDNDASHGEPSNGVQIFSGSPPLITDVQPLTGEAGADVMFYSSFTGDFPLTFAWDFGGAATPDTSTEETPWVTLSSIEGNYNASLNISNDYGYDTFDFTLTVVPPNIPPTASIVPNVSDGSAPLSVFFDATGSSDPDGAISDYEWDLDGDGLYNEPGDEETYRLSLIASYEYTIPGTYYPALRVTDDDGAPDTDSVTITVN